MSSHAEYTRELAHAGHAFKVEIFTEDPATPPWENSAGHGPVRTAPRAEKRPGERIIGPTGSRDWWYLYDFQAATKIAYRDNWGSGRVGAVTAVLQDFEYLRGWLRDEWHYVGVCVTHEASGATIAVWGIESTETAYHNVYARALAAECMSDIRFTEWKARLADRERALDVAQFLKESAAKIDSKRATFGMRKTEWPNQLREAAALLESLARGT